MLKLLPITILVNLLLTIVIELSIALILKVRDKKDILNIILVNIMTNPLVVVISNIILLFNGIYYRNISMIFLELFAFITEGIIYKKFLIYKKINPYIISIILNSSSIVLGLLIIKII